MIIYSNYDMSDAFEETKQFIMEEYPEQCDVEVEDEDGNVTYEPSDSKVWDWVYDEDQLYWDEIWKDLKKKLGDETVIAVGSLGTWRGNYEGSKIGSFEDVFNACVTDCDYVEITSEDGHFYIKSSMHDGTNYLELKIVTEEGKEKYNDWENDWNTDISEHDINKEIFENYSELPNYEGL